MSRHDPSVSLRHMRDHAHELVDIVRGRSRGDLDTADAYRLSLILGQLCKSMETTTQADEIEALEAVAAQKGLRVA